MKTLFFCGVTLAVTMVMGCASEPPEQAPGEDGFALRLRHHDAAMHTRAAPKQPACG